VEKVEALYEEPPDPPETPEMRRLRLEHSRMLGNGWCIRPSYLDCSFEALCEGCGFFATTVEFKGTLERLRAEAATTARSRWRHSTRGSLAYSNGSVVTEREDIIDEDLIDEETDCVIDDALSVIVLVQHRSSDSDGLTAVDARDEQTSWAEIGHILGTGRLFAVCRYGPFGQRRRTPLELD